MKSEKKTDKLKNEKLLNVIPSLNFQNSCVKAEQNSEMLFNHYERRNKMTVLHW